MPDQVEFGHYALPNTVQPSMEVEVFNVFASDLYLIICMSFFKITQCCCDTRSSKTDFAAPIRKRHTDTMTIFSILGIPGDFSCLQRFCVDMPTWIVLWVTALILMIDVTALSFVPRRLPLLSDFGGFSHASHLHRKSFWNCFIVWSRKI